MNIQLSPSIVFLLLGVIVILVIKDQLRALIDRIGMINYNDKFKIILDQFKPRKEVNNKNKDKFFEKIYEKISGAQIHFLVLLRQFYTKGGKMGMPCGYASNYHVSFVKPRTHRYDGWITPFFTAYMEENNLVSVSEGYYHMEKLGFDFLDYLEKMGYSEKDKEF